MPVVINKNERSWAIDIISKINEIAGKTDLLIKKAGGESTISLDKKNRMFPDVILYGNKEQSEYLQGWELKMPDVPIEDETFIKDAQRKAIALGLNSCLIWNFTYAVLYVRTDSGFRIAKQWNETSHIKTRKDVSTYQNDWEKLLEDVLYTINEYFLKGDFKKTNLENVISESVISALLEQNKKSVAEKLRRDAISDSVMEAYIDAWWMSVKHEYEKDETDKYNAYAKNVLLNWSNRVLFANIIKKKQTGAVIVESIKDGMSPTEANEVFKKITMKCDFYNIFTEVRYGDIVPKNTWDEIVEFNDFLQNSDISNLDQRIMQDILERSINTTKRAINGQYTTPVTLARILTKITVRDWNKNFLDCCCGTGTIPKEAISIKRSKLGDEKAIETVRACDKNSYPLQIANISMTEPSSIKLANRLFRYNALALKCGDKVKITNPEDGSVMQLKIPFFSAVASNLPFVAFEIIPPDDMELIVKNHLDTVFDGRSDLYNYIAFKVADVIEPGGLLGIITSNSWLGTGAGTKFLNLMMEKYNLCQVHISGKGRWFKNADVVTTITIFEKKGMRKQGNIDFFVWKKSLQEIENNEEYENYIVNSAIMGEELKPEVMHQSRYNFEQVNALAKMNISYNALFHQVDWLLSFKDSIIQIDTAFNVFRGSRRGWDALFYPQKGEHNIEEKYLKKVLKNARNVDTLITEAHEDVFCCGETIEILKKNNSIGALNWIEKFIDQKNGVGKPLPTVLKKANLKWYEMEMNEIAEVFTMMNPDKRLFFSSFKAPSFLNQRLIGLNHKADYSDTELNHALLNSVFTMFYIEASGFGRGLGVLDINKDSIAKCFMFDPNAVDKDNREKIVDAFKPLKDRNIMNVADELKSPDRLAFEETVFKAFKLEKFLPAVINSLLSMQSTRATAREK